MALSGNQITSVGVIGFPGQAYLGFTAKKEFIEAVLPFSLNAYIDQYGQGVTGEILAQGQSVSGSIVGNFGVYAIIDSDGQGVSGSIDGIGQGVNGAL